MKSAIVEQRGHFWWQDEPILKGNFAPENHITGVLTIQEDGSSKLELDGTFPSADHLLTRLTKRSQSKRQERAIQGILKGTGQHVLLLDAVENGGTFNTNRFSYERYSATRCLLSDSEFPRGTSGLRFSAMQVRLTGLEDWFRLGSIAVNRTSRSISAKQRILKDILYSISDGSLCLEHFTSGPYPGKHRSHELILREFMTLILRLRKSMSVDAVRDEFQFLQDLFTLLTDSHYSLDWPTVTPVRSKKRYTLYFQRHLSSAAAPAWHECPTNFIQLKPHFGKIFDTWRTKRVLFGAGFYSYLSTRRDMTLYVENRFTNLVGGMEMFHRIKFPNAESSANIDTKISRILENIKLVKDRKWLARILIHKNEPTLEKRIFENIRDLPLGLDEGRLRHFATGCANWRNEIAHFMGERQQGNRTNFLVNLSKNSDALAFLYHMTLLREIGVSDDALRWWLYEGFRSFRLKYILVEVGLLDKEILTPRPATPVPVIKK
jgi:ApeA N-terminal domain 1